MGAAVAAATQASEAHLDPLLRRYGFAPASPSPWASFHRIWVRRRPDGDEQFVEVSISLDPRDIPYFVGVAFGEGAVHSFLARELHSVPLWQVVKERVGDRGPSYGIDDETDVERVTVTIARDLEEHAGDFLAGDLSTYRRLRRPVPAPPRARIGLTIAAALVARYLPELVWQALRRRRRR